MIESFQDEMSIEKQEPEESRFAFVGTVYEDGLSLIFAGEDTESLKHYKCNSSIVFKTGDKVYLSKDSGSYIVLFPIGNPLNFLNADYAESAGTATTASTATNAQKLNNKTESQLSVSSASTATTATTSIGVDNTGTSSSDIQFRAVAADKLEFRRGTGSWHTLQNQT